MLELGMSTLLEFKVLKYFDACVHLKTRLEYTYPEENHSRESRSNKFIFRLQKLQASQWLLVSEPYNIHAYTNINMKGFKLEIALVIMAFYIEN